MHLYLKLKLSRLLGNVGGAPVPQNIYLQPDGSSYYFQPDGASFYIQP